MLAPLAAQGFVLHGGTAIAPRLGHRDSIDFDFSTQDPLDRESLYRSIPLLSSSKTIQEEADTLTVLIPVQPSEVKVSFFGGIKFGRVGEPDFTHDGVAVIASLQDLLAQNLKVVMQRVESKDYVDIAAVLRSGLTLKTGMEGALALFGPAFSPHECAKALVYFKGGDLVRVDAADRAVLINTVRSLKAALGPSVIRSLSLSSERPDLPDHH